MLFRSVCGSLQLSLLPRPRPFSTVWHHLFCLSPVALQEQNGYLATPGTEQEQWLEGPDPDLKQRLQDEIGQLRTMVTNGGVSATPAVLPRGSCRMMRSIH